MPEGQDPVRVFLDDERQPPPGWLHVRWPDEAIQWLKTGRVEALSLDHDLGDDSRGTGYAVLLWLEEQVALYGMKAPRIHIHSANSSARIKMLAACDSIERLSRRPP